MPSLFSVKYQVSNDYVDSNSSKPVRIIQQRANKYIKAGHESHRRRENSWNSRFQSHGPDQWIRANKKPSLRTARNLIKTRSQMQMRVVDTLGRRGALVYYINSGRWRLLAYFN